MNGIKGLGLGLGGFSKASWRLHSLCLLLALGSFVWGYNVGVLASVLAHPGFRETIPGYGPYRRGLITAIYYLGTWLSYVFFSRPAADFLGRRYAAMVGMSVLCVGQALQAAASGSLALSMVIFGRVVSGLGTGIVSTSVPLYQSEIAPAKQRGKLVVLNHVGFVAGLASGFWVGYAITFWNNTHGYQSGWRLSVSLSFIPALLFLLGLPFLYESPRWLVEHNHHDEALRSLQFYREGSFTPKQIQDELTEIARNVAVYQASTSLTKWTSLFTNPSLFSRLWRAALLHFMAQMCGATAMKYYLPELFRVLGLSPRVSLLAGGIESTLKIGCTVLEMFIIDKVGRRVTLAVGAGIMAFALLVNGALPLIYPDNTNRLADYTCVVFIFIYSLGYSMGFGPAAWVYGSEIFPTAARARGLSFAASGGAVGSIIVSQLWPVGIAELGSKIYFFFMAVNLVCVPVIFLLYPETKGRPLEDMEVLFGGDAGRWRSRTPSTTSLLLADERDRDGNGGDEDEDDETSGGPLLGERVGRGVTTSR
ncbi:general substrate transporter [Sordaria brevicollis]|uniref:General substrate transporter n=1 Tax=Sordaria brevicollis TaxID=83679 RepID=A0AAE0PKZ9_SORBR|nr:general substrate transporter [Sordaria brevicollis]